MVESLYEHQYFVGSLKAEQVTGYFYLFAKSYGTNRDDKSIAVFIFPLELEKQSVASVIIKPLLSLKKPVCLGKIFCHETSFADKLGNI